MYRLAGQLAPWFAVTAGLLLLTGTYGGLVLAPADYLQGDGFRIIYVHVPSAYLSMLAYIIMATSATVGFIWRIKMAHGLAVSAAPLGASFTLLALVTGGIWGKPMWGTYWQWADARLMSELLLLFLLAAVGVINIPIIHYSVEWWSTLHQGPTIGKLDQPSITMDMLSPLLVMILGFTIFFAWLLCKRLQGEILNREGHARWVEKLLEEITR